MGTKGVPRAWQSLPLRLAREESKIAEGKPNFKTYVPKHARDMSKFSNKVPFSEDMLEKIRFAIDLISGRMKDKTPLNEESLDKLDAYINDILDDADKYRPAQRPSNPGEEE